jgi:hypothetical protein
MQPVVPDATRLFSQSPQTLGTFYSRQHDIYNGSSFPKVVLYPECLGYRILCRKKLQKLYHLFTIILPFSDLVTIMPNNNQKAESQFTPSVLDS